MSTDSNQTTENELIFQDGQIVWNYIFLCILFFAILLNNSLVLVAVWGQKRLKSQLNAIILASLALAQLIGGLISIPIHMALVQEYSDDSTLKFSVIVMVFTGVVTQLHLSILCGDRYIACVDHGVDLVAHGTTMRGVVIGTTIVAWLLSLLVALLSLVDFKNYSVLVVVFFMLPILLDVLGYTSLYRSSKGHNQTTLLKKEIRLTKWFIIFTVMFNFLWLPFMITILLRDHCESCDTEQSSVYLFVLYFELFGLTISSAVYYRASRDFHLAFKAVGQELFNTVSRNANSRSDPSPDVMMCDSTITRDSKEKHVNMGMVCDCEEDRSTRQSKSSLQNSKSDNSPPKLEHEEVNIVPFDQTKYLDGKDGKQEDFYFEDVNEVNGGTRINDGFGFHDIDIVPYDQSC